MTNTILTQETINNASFRELQVLAKENGIKASGKGVTAEYLRTQLLTLVPAEESQKQVLMFEGIPMPVPVESQQEVAQEKTETKTPVQVQNKPNNIKLQKLVYEKGIYKWDVEYRPRARGLKEADAVEAAFKIAQCVYRMPNSKYQVIADKEMVDAYKVNAIFSKTLGTDSKLDIQNAVLFFRQMQWIVPAEMSTKSVYFVTKRFYEFVTKYAQEETAE